MSLFVSAFVLGLAFFATPGAITAQLIRGLGQRGFCWALWLQLGALLGLICWATIALVGAAFVLHHPFARVLSGAVGVLLLLWLAWQSLKDAYRGTDGEIQMRQGRGAFVLGVALTLANPFPVVFWLSILPTLLASGQGILDLKTGAAFFAGFLSSALIWAVVMAGLIAWGQRFVTPVFLRLVNLVCGLALGFFAFRLLWSMLPLMRI